MPFSAEIVDAWNGFVARVNGLGPEWIFCGGLQGWQLETTLEHACRAFQIEPDLPLSISRDRYPNG
jgi:hypothetical protein